MGRGYANKNGGVQRLCDDQDFQTRNFSGKVLIFSVEKYTSMSDRSNVWLLESQKDQEELLVKLMKIDTKHHM